MCILFAVGCAKVRVEAPKEAFKVDISMRLDIYQHVGKDIDSIENIVSGAAQKQSAPGAKNLLNIILILSIDFITTIRPEFSLLFSDITRIFIQLIFLHLPT